MRRWLYLSLAVFFGLLVASWLTHSKGVIRNDPARGIELPDESMVPLQVKAAYDGKYVYFRYRWPAPKRTIDYDVLRYQDGKWVRDGGSKSSGDYEDRISTMIDDGSVPEFGRYGAYVMANPKMWSTGEGNDEEEVANHPYLGVKKGQREVGKYLPTTRRQSEDWASVVPEPELSRLRAAGYFVDLWQWRVNRTNPVGKTDDGLVAEARYADPGKSVFFGSNWSAKDGQPKMMFDPAKTGHRALTWKEVADGHIAAADLYVREDQALPFDPKQPWKDGDTIPARLMHPGEGSADDLAVVGRPQWSEGHWDVTLRRSMNTGHPQDDKAMLDKGVYTLAFGIHRSTEGGSRFHYVSLPVSLGLDRDAQVNAVQVAEGKAPTWDQEWTSVTLFYPGRVAWSTLASKRHAGSKFIERGVPVKFRHSEKQLAHYGLEAMFADEVWRQWLKTMFAGIALIAAFGFTLHRLLASDAKRTQP